MYKGAEEEFSEISLTGRAQFFINIITITNAITIAITNAITITIAIIITISPLPSPSSCPPATLHV